MKIFFIYIIWAIIILLAILIVFMIIPIGIKIKYDNEFNFKVKFLKKEFNFSKNHNQAKKGDIKRKPKVSSSNIINEFFSRIKEFIEKNGLFESTQYLKKVIIVFNKSISYLLKKIDFHVINLYIDVSSNDAYSTAIRYNQCSAIIYPLMSKINEMATPKICNIDIKPNFKSDSDNPNIKFNIYFSGKIFFILCTVIIFLISYVKYSKEKI